jgi:RimJ/RimL family protein N-acetyltransferase
MREREQPVLSAGPVQLRPWVQGDVPAVVEAYADPSIQQWHFQVLDPDEANAWITHWEAAWQRESDACWAAVDPSHPAVVLGRIALREIDLAAGAGETGAPARRRVARHPRPCSYPGVRVKAANGYCRSRCPQTSN